MALTFGIDLGSQTIKIVAGRMKGPVFEIQRAVTVPVADPNGGEDAILATIPAIAAALGKTRAAGARFGISGRDLIIRYTQVPDVPLWRLRLLMDFEVREMSEQAGEALVSDYNLLNLPGRAEGEETVLVALVKEHFLEARHEALKQAVGEPRSGLPCSLALFNAYLHSGDLHEGEFVLLVDIGDRNMEVVLERDGEILFARNMAAGGRLMTEALGASLGLAPDQAERVKIEYGNVTPKGQASYASGKEEKAANALAGPVGQLSGMIQSCVQFSRMQTGIRDLHPGRIMLSGGGSELRGLEAYLKSNFKCPVEHFLPHSGLDTSSLPIEEAAVFDAGPGRFSVALGLAVAASKENAFVVDLVPAPVVKRRNLLRRSLFLWLSAAAALIFLVVQFFQLQGEAGRLEVERATARRDANLARQAIEDFGKESKRIRDLNARIGILADQTRPLYALMETQRLVQQATPDGVLVTTIETAYKRPEAEPGKDPRTDGLKLVVLVSGSILGIERDPNAALLELTDGIRGGRAGTLVTIESQETGVVAGSRSLGFKLAVDLFPEPPLAAAEVN